MIDEASAAAAAWKERGVDVEVVVQSSDVDVQGQIAAVRNFINQGVDAIIINPNSPTAFDPIFAEAAGRGILVIGEVHVLIGSNGCGKSTLCKVIAGVIAADGGSLKIDGADVDFASPTEAVASRVGVFYQELSLVPTLSVAENILLGREPKLLGWGRRGFVDTGAQRRYVEAALARFGDVAGPGLTPDALVSDLPADQRQIVEILKVLSQDGRILIFDEATSSLDARQVEVFFRIVRELKGEGRGIIFISHRMDEVFAIGDGVEVVRMLMALYRSAELGRTVTLDEPELETYVPLVARP